MERNISKTAGFREFVHRPKLKDHQQEMAYGLSNGHATDYVTWLRRCCTVGYPSDSLASCQHSGGCG